MSRRFALLKYAVMLALCGWMAQAQALVLPGAADVGRVKAEDRTAAPVSDKPVLMLPGQAPVKVPDAAKNVRLVLKDIHIVGATVYPAAQLHAMAEPYLGKEVSLEVVYALAAAITERYRDDGYFLSLAYVPDQHIAGGVVTIKVVEGYVGHVEVNGDKLDSIAQVYIDRVLAQRPLQAKTLEGALLRLNDLPDYSFRGVLSAQEKDPEGSVTLTLVPAVKEAKGSLSMDNFSSRYFDPHELSASYARSLLPQQQTSISGISTFSDRQFGRRLRSGTIDHTAAIAPDLVLGFNGSLSHAEPGFTLAPFGVISDSESLAASLAYQWMRQRDENLSFKLTFDGKNSESDLLRTLPFTRDRIRALRLNMTYDISDRFDGYNLFTVTVSRGVPVFHSSQAGDSDLSRAGARPDFTKEEFSVSRVQGIMTDWTLVMTATGQLSSGVLYSSEEFGYGGQAFGRAFDNSEIIGDEGVNGSLEMRYGGWSTLVPVSVQPYLFYDGGAICNQGVGGKCETAKSTGFGVRGSAPLDTSFNFGMAWPLGHDESTPIYVNDGSAPRIIFQISKNF